MRKSTTFTSWGYTLVEILIVISIMSAFGVMAIYGIRNTNNSQSVTDGQRNFISDFRGLQNKVLNGADAAQVKSVVISSPDQKHYVLDGITVALPNGVSFINSTTTICVFNPRATNFNCLNGATTCPGSFVCPALGVGSDSVAVSFTNGTTTKLVTIQGSMTTALGGPGTAIYRVYAN